MIVWDNVSFHRSNIIRQWFETHNRMLMEFISPYLFLNPTEEFFSAWRWKVYDHQPHTVTLLAAMGAGCNDTTADACRGWIRHSKRFFPCTREDIRCDVDENLWPNRQEQGVGRLQCNFYSAACTVFRCSHFYLCFFVFFSLCKCSAVL